MPLHLFIKHSRFILNISGTSLIHYFVSVHFVSVILFLIDFTIVLVQSISQANLFSLGILLFRLVVYKQSLKKLKKLFPVEDAGIVLCREIVILYQKPDLSKVSIIPETKFKRDSHE